MFLDWLWGGGFWFPQVLASPGGIEEEEARGQEKVREKLHQKASVGTQAVIPGEMPIAHHHSWASGTIPHLGGSVHLGQPYAPPSPVSCPTNRSGGGQPGRKQSDPSSAIEGKLLYTGQFPQKGSDLPVEVGALQGSLKDICYIRA